MTTTNYAQMVSRGIELLDLNVLGWTELIDLEQLNLNSIENCVLGQLFGDYFTGLRELGLVDLGSYDIEQIEAHGFTLAHVPFEDNPVMFAELTDAWKEALA